MKKLFTIFLALIVFFVLPLPAEAAIESYLIRDDQAEIFIYDLSSLLSAYNTDGVLWEDFSEKMNKHSVLAVYDNVSKLYVDFVALLDAYNAGEEITAYTESSKAKTISPFTAMTEVKVDQEGKLVYNKVIIEEEAGPEPPVEEPPIENPNLSTELKAINAAKDVDSMTSALLKHASALDLTLTKYNKLNDYGKQLVARKLLEERGSGYTTNSAVKKIFDAETDKYTYNYYVSADKVLYGLDYWRTPVRLTNAPDFLPPGEYVVTNNYTFSLITANGLENKGKFNYNEEIPYAVLPLDRPADPKITEALLKSVAQSKNAHPSFIAAVPAFLKAQETWGVNALYLMAHAALESNWGKSQIACDKNNIFGYMAYDSNPYASAATFASKDDCIYWVGAFIRKCYLLASDWRFNGENLVGMNVYYATDPMWAVKIANIMEQIYPSSQYEKVSKPENKGKVNVSALNVRSGAGTTYSVVTTLSKDTELTIHAMKSVYTSGSYYYWFKVVSGTFGEGWVRGDYVDLTTKPEANVYLAGWYKNKDTKASLCQTPAGTVKKSIAFMTPLTVEGVQMVGKNLWLQVNYEGNLYWLNGDNAIVKW